MLAHEGDLAASTRIGGGTDFAGNPGSDAVFAEQGNRLVDIVGGGQGDHANTAVECHLEVGLRNVANTSYDVKDRLRRPGGAINRGRQLDRHHSLQVGGEPATGDVGHRMSLGVARQI